MKHKAIRPIFFFFMHHSIHAILLSSAMILISYIEYMIAYKVGMTVFQNPEWVLRFFVIFFGSDVLLNYLFYWKFKKNKMTLSNYDLHLTFEKEFSSKENVMHLLKRHMFCLESQQEDRLVGQRIVGKILKRKQYITIYFIKDRAYFEVELLNTIYPIDYFLYNYHLKLSFLNNR